MDFMMIRGLVGVSLLGVAAGLVLRREYGNGAALGFLALAIGTPSVAAVNGWEIDGRLPLSFLLVSALILIGMGVLRRRRAGKATTRG